MFKTRPVFPLTSGLSRLSTRWKILVRPSFGVVPRVIAPWQRGFTMGGYDFFPNPTNTIRRFEKAKADSGLTTLSATLSSVRWHAGCPLRGLYRGYTAGGFSSSEPDVATIDAFNYGFESSLVLANQLPATRSDANLSCINVPASRGYVCGGIANPPNAAVASIVGFSFATEVAAAISSVLAAARQHTSGCTSALAGFLMGGQAVSIDNVIQKMVLSSEAVSTLAATLDVARMAAGAFSAPLKGYVVGGFLSPNPPHSSDIDDMDYVAETSAKISSSLSAPCFSQGCPAFADRGYKITGGGTAQSTTIESLIWSTQAVAIVGAALANAATRSDAAGHHTSGMP